MGKWQCQRSGNCCRWPGVVRVNEEEIARIAAYLKMDEQKFIEDFTEITYDRKGLTLISRDSGACFFLEGKNHCLLQEVKPDQCTNFLDTWIVPNLETKCEAIWDENAE